MIDGRVTSLLKSIALENQPYDLFDSLTPEDKAYNRGYVDGYEEFLKIIKQRVMEDKTPEFFDTIISKENAYKEGYVIGYIEGLKSDRCK